MFAVWSIQKIVFIFVTMSFFLFLSLRKASYGYLILTAIIFLRPQDDRPVFATLHIPMIIILFAFAGLFREINRDKIDVQNIIGFPTFKLFILFLIILLVTSATAVSTETAWTAASDFQFIGAFFILTLFSLRNEKDFRYLIYVTLLCGLYFSYLLQFRGSYMTESISGESFNRLNFQRLNINFGNPNYLAITMVVMFIFSFCQTLYYKKILYKMVFLVPCLIYIYTLIKTMSRGGTLSLGISLIYMILIYSQKKFRNLLILSILIIFIISIIPSIFPNYFDRMQTISSYKEDKSATNRLDLWSKGIGLILNHPFLGIGLNNFGIITYNTAHNSYIQIASELGIPGFIIWGLLFYKGWSFARIVRKTCSNEMQQSRSLYFIGLSFETSLFACAFQSLVTGMGHREILFWLIALGSSVFLSFKNYYLNTIKQTFLWHGGENEYFMSKL